MYAQDPQLQKDFFTSVKKTILRWLLIVIVEDFLQ